MPDGASAHPDDEKLGRYAANLRGMHDAADVQQPDANALAAPEIWVGAEGEATYPTGLHARPR